MKSYGLQALVYFHSIVFILLKSDTLEFTLALIKTAHIEFEAGFEHEK